MLRFNDLSFEWDLLTTATLAELSAVLKNRIKSYQYGRSFVLTPQNDAKTEVPIRHTTSPHL